MFDDVKTAKRAKRAVDFECGHIGFFFKGLIHYFESKYESFFFDCLNRGRKDVFHC